MPVGLIQALVVGVLFQNRHRVDPGGYGKRENDEVGVAGKWLNRFFELIHQVGTNTAATGEKEVDHLNFTFTLLRSEISLILVREFKWCDGMGNKVFDRVVIIYKNRGEIGTVVIGK